MPLENFDFGDHVEYKNATKDISSFIKVPRSRSPIHRGSAVHVIGPSLPIGQHFMLQ